MDNFMEKYKISTIRLSYEEWKKFKILCSAQEKSMSGFVSEWIRKEAKKIEKKDSNKNDAMA
jgi:hypothetical protein